MKPVYFRLLRGIRHLFPHRYDVVISLGQHCATAMYMNRSGLRTFSSPLDWLEGSRVGLEKCILLIEREFENFLPKESLIARASGEVSDGKHRYYDDASMGFGVFHDFPLMLTMAESYPMVMTKYKRRINRVYDLVPRGGRVLFVYSAVYECLRDCEVIDFTERLRRKFGNRAIDLLVLQNNGAIVGLGNAVSPALGTIVVEGCFHPTPMVSFWGDIKLNDAVFGQIPKGFKLQLNYLRKRIFESSIRLISVFIVNRARRKAFRKRHLDMI